MTATTPFWGSIERHHRFIYFLPDIRARYEAVGLKGNWMAYFASRSAALGTPSAELVIATFHGFAPRMVRRAIPDAWSMASSEDVLTVRRDLARETISRALTDEQIAPTADAIVEVVAGMDFAGKPLAAAHAALPVPEDPIGQFWHAVTVAREYRGDCHIAVLVAEGLDGVDSNVLAVAAQLTFPDQKSLRGWNDEEWAAGQERLIERGWLDANGALTEDGRLARTAIEDATDAACAAGMTAAATAKSAEITDDLRVAGRALKESLSQS